MEINARIRETRIEKGYTQSFVADTIQCDQSTYSKYELGKREIPLWLVVRLSELYQTSIDFLVGKTDVQKPYPPAKRRYAE